MDNQIWYMFEDDEDIPVVAAITLMIEKEMRAKRRVCAWQNTVPQLLEKEMRPCIQTVLQSLHHVNCGNIRKMDAGMILLAYWRLLGRGKREGRKTFLQFLHELSLNPRPGMDSG